MKYDELHVRYGSHVASRVQEELPPAEFAKAKVENLLSYLEKRAETAHQEYQARLENPFTNEDLGNNRPDYVDTLYRHWCDAEDLAYLVAVAENANARAGGKKRA